MSEPINHHWLPQFLMRPWCGSDKKVERFYRPNKKVVVGRKPPASLGAEDHLYTVICSTLADPYYFEKEVMTKESDTPNSRIRDEILAGNIPNISRSDRREFARFLLFLKLRRPDSVKPHKERVRRPFAENAEELRAALAAHDPEYFDRHFAPKLEDLLGASDLIAMQSVVDAAATHSILPEIVEAIWRIIDVSACPVTLVLGDNPVLWKIQDGAFECLKVPLSPTKALVIGTKLYFKNDLTLKDENTISFVLDFNRTQFEMAADFAIAIDQGPSNGFVTLAEKYMPIRS